MTRSNILLLGATALLGLVSAQKPNGKEVHPKITTYRCTKAKGCKPETNYIVLDSLAHPVHQVGSSIGCGNWGEAANSTACPTKEACAKNCIMEGITDYSKYGVTTKGDSLRLQMIVGTNTVSPRVYLLDKTENKYEMTKFTGGEFSFDVDAKKLPCGMNGALYLSEMEADGGKSAINKGGAYWGTGYCDAQCYTTPFINGEGNLKGYGACCNEMDIWEANGRATHIAPHTCNVTGVYECSGAECTREGVCDKPGCGWNPYRINQPDYYGAGSKYRVDTTRKLTVVTQFPADKKGKLLSIVRLYVQDGNVIHAETVNKPGLPAVDRMTQEFCDATGAGPFTRLGGIVGMGEAMARGMVLAMSVWWDAGGNMQWLDGAAQGAGPCDATEGNPTNVVKVEPLPEVSFSNMRWGEIDSTYKKAGPKPPTPGYPTHPRDISHS
ncbi:endoglucanase-like protein [Microdochium bolleyi]|uniref:Glucanase n=1 Tax=Microdochium bolleyi TaxID=196109 RepID=A0A136IY24_9PEZI|nr:endoglucanase-like protein [Microdochium bolleyi]